MILGYSYNHHEHSYYLIKNADLVGFSQDEIAIMAGIAFFHRKKFPKNSHGQMKKLNKAARRTVKIGSILIRIAEALDRSHKNVVQQACFSQEGDTLYLDIHTGEDYQLELWQVNNQVDRFEKYFGKPYKARLFPEES